MLKGFRERARTNGLGDAIGVYGLSLFLVVLAAAAVVRLTAAAIFGH